MISKTPLAALVARGQVGPLEVTGEAISADDILAVSRRIEIVEAEDLSERFPNEILSRVSVLLRDGQRFTSPTTAAKGDPDTAMSAERRDAIVAAVAGLPATDDCTSLFEQIFRREVGTVGAA